MTTEVEVKVHFAFDQLSIATLHIVMNRLSSSPLNKTNVVCFLDLPRKNQTFTSSIVMSIIIVLDMVLPI